MFQKLKKHYHWVIVVVLFFITAIRGGAANNLAGLHLIPVTEALDMTRAQFSIGSSVGSVLNMLTTFVSGALILRFGYRVLLVVFLLLAAVAYGVLGSAESYGAFLLGYALIGISSGICGEAGLTRVVSMWFHKHRGAVLGAVSAATGLGGSVLCIFQTAVMERDGYRASFALVAALFAVCAALAVVFVRNHPSKLGLRPYGDGQVLEHQKREHEQDHWHGLTMKQIARSPAFYLLLVGTLLCCMLPYSAFSVVVPHLQDRGLSPMQTSSIQSVLLLVLAGSKFLMGYLCDAIGARKVAVMCICLCMISLLLLTVVSGMTATLLVIIVFGAALPLVTGIVPLVAMSLFGYRAQAEYNGIFIAMVPAASFLANYIANAVYDRVGSYNPVFCAAAALGILVIGIYLLAFRFANRDRAAQEEAEAKSVQ